MSDQTGRDPVTISHEELNRLLRSQPGLTVERLTPGRNDAPPTLTIRLHNQTFDVPVHGLALPQDVFTALQTAKAATKPAQAQTKDDVPDPTVAYLKENDLPLYWNRKWLEARLKQHGTYAEVARRHEQDVLGVSPTTLANYARKAYGWQVRAETSRKRDRVVQDYQAEFDQGVTQPQLAARHGVSVSTVHRWLSEGREAYEAVRKDRDRLAGDHAALAELAHKHKFQVETLAPWLEGTSDAYESEHATQPKRHYYSRSEYAEKKERVRAEYRQAGRKLNRGQLADELGVDPTTITSWIQAIDQEDRNLR
jgi:transcriptional regulator with XRE-family HTH domain